MRRSELEHLIRAAAVLADDLDIVVVSSQAILGSAPDAPAVLVAATGADVFPRNHPERSAVIDGAIGEASAFRETFGYHARGVGPDLAAPAGWEERLVLLPGPGAGGARGWCLEPHDLVVTKCAAGRTRDFAFATEALAAGLVDGDLLRARVETLPMDEDHLEVVRGFLRALVA